MVQCRNDLPAAALPLSSLLITFHCSLLVIGFFTIIVYEGKGKKKRGIRGRGKAVGSQSNITSSVGDPYMTSD